MGVVAHPPEVFHSSSSESGACVCWTRLVPQNGSLLATREDRQRSVFHHSSSVSLGKKGLQYLEHVFWLGEGSVNHKKGGTNTLIDLDLLENLRKIINIP